MAERWEPARSPADTDLVYRSQFTSAAPDLHRRTAEQFRAWIAAKGVDVSLAALVAGGTTETLATDDVRRVASSTVGAHTDRATGRRLDAATFRLDERHPDGTGWTTTLRLAVPHQPDGVPGTVTPDAVADRPAEAWLWLDLEHHRGPSGPAVRPGSPRLIRDLLAALEGTDGSLPLTSDLLDITAGHTGELCGWLFDPRRRVPVIVFTPDQQSAEEQHRFAERLARDVAGVAVVVRLPDAAAAAAFSGRVGPHLQVYGGAMRTYLPGLTPLEPFPRRHRILSAATMRALRFRSAFAVRDQVLGLSTRRPPPVSHPLARRISAQDASGHDGASPVPPPPPPDHTDEIDLLYAEIDDLTRQLGDSRRALAEVEDLRTERDVVTLDLSDAERRNEKLTARVRWLENELTRHRVHLTGVEPHGGFEPPVIPSAVVEVLGSAGARLVHVEIGDTLDAAAGLDVHPRADLWAVKVWQALEALESYARARRDGRWNDSFRAWCQAPPPGGAAVPATWVALHESETTNSTPRLRESRTFPVPTAIQPAGRLYMPAHIKIQQGGTPCPRMHFHDDTGGVTGRVVVGYVGDHLPTATFH